MAKFSFHNYPKRLKLDDYDLARERLHNLFTADGCGYSLVEYGQVQSPGVSDLDIMVVVNDKCYDAGSLTKNLKNDQITKKFLENGTIITVPIEVFKHLHFIDSFGDFKVLSGEKVSQNYPDKELNSSLKFVSLMDWLPERYMRLQSIASSSKIDVINTLGILHSVKYSIRNFENFFGIQLAESKSFFRNVETLRQSWWKEKQPEIKLFNAVHSGLDLLKLCLVSLGDFFHRNVIDACGLLANKMPLVRVNLHKSLSLLKSEGQNNIDIFYDNKPIGELPFIYYFHFWFMASFSNRLSSHLLENFGLKTCETFELVQTSEIPYFKTLEQKISLLNRNFEFILRSNLRAGMVRYGQFINI